MKFALAQRPATQAAIVSFFFNTQGDNLEKSTAGIYRSLLHQLLVKLPDLQELLDAFDFDPKPAWDVRVLRRLFTDATTRLSRQKANLLC